MAEEGVAAEGLLEVPRCRAVLIGTSQAAAGEAGHTPVVQFAEGTLRIFKLPPSAPDATSEAPRVVLAIADAAASERLDGGFYYPILADMPVCKAGGRCLTLPDPEGDDNFGVLFDEGGLDVVAALLEEYGCRVWQQSDPEVVAALAQSSAAAGSTAAKHGKTATATAGAVQDAAAAATGAIKLATGALSWGIRAATAEAKQSPLMVPTDKPVAVPSAVKKTATAGRTATSAVVMVSGAAVDSAAKLAGSLAGKASSAAASVAKPGGSGGGASSAWMADATYVGGSSLSAGVAVFLALNEAADQLVQESLGSGADLVGHKLGEEAGATTREGFHVVGNVMAAKSLLTTKAVAKTVGKKAAVGAASGAAEAWDTGVRTAPVLTAPSSGGGLILGPR